MLGVLNLLKQKMKKIEDSIASLEKEEDKLAKEYGMAGHFDSVNVLQEAKRRAFAARQNLSISTQLHDSRQGLIRVSVFHLCLTY